MQGYAAFVTDAQEPRVRLLDSTSVPLRFEVKCRQHGQLDDGLTLKQARTLQDRHRQEHQRAEALDFPPPS